MTNTNTGNSNTGDWNTGYSNTITPKETIIFNKPSTFEAWEDTDKPNWMYCNLISWVEEEDMTDKEKDSYPSYVTTGGYLKYYNSLQDAWKDSWDKASLEDKKKTENLPNFDKEVFKELFGFEYNVGEDKKKVTLELTDEQLEKIKDIIKE